MKTKTTTRAIFIILIMMLFARMVFSQGNTWKLDGNNNIGSYDYIGSKNNADFKIYTNNQLRINVGKDGTTEFFGKVKMTMDSLTLDFFNLKGLMKTDSIHVLGGAKFGNSISINVIPNEIFTDATAPFDLFIQCNPAFNNNTILNANGNTGNVGIGTTSPSSLLHLNSTSIGEVFRTNCPANVNSFWRMEKDNTPVFHISSPANSPWVFLQTSQQGSRLLFNTSGNNTRMVIANNLLNEPRVGIGAILNPLAYLHIGTDPILPGTGIRNWMNFGTLYNRNTDNMYVGLQVHDNDLHDAIINWGNNPIQQAEVDRLRFVFTAAINLGLTASSNDGLEIARMVSNGNDGFTGIGDFLTPGLDPINRLDVRGNAVIGNNYAGLVTAPINGLLVQGFTGIGNAFSPGYQPARQLEVFNATAPQLRLSRAWGTIELFNKFTDFETTQAGNLRINPGAGVLAVNGDGVYVNIKTYLLKIETLEARLLLSEECLALMQPTHANK